MKRALSDDKKESEITRCPDFPNIAWKALGSLNAGLTVPLDIRLIRKYISHASQLALSDAYPILLWAISNLRQKYANIQDAEKLLRPVFEATILACQVSERMACRAACVSPVRAIAELKEGRSVLIRPGEYEQANQHLKNWVAEHTEEFIVICDPYFTQDELYILKWILELKPSLQIKILTGIDHKGSQTQSLENIYKSKWSSISENDPPNTEIYTIGTHPGGKFPIHDRWLISKTSGIRLVSHNI